MPKPSRLAEKQEQPHTARHAAETTPAAGPPVSRLQRLPDSPAARPEVSRLQRLPDSPAAATPADVTQLQARYGNRAVRRLLGGPTVQAKLQVGAANDPYEQEADRVADQVMRLPAGAGKDDEDKQA